MRVLAPQLALLAALAVSVPAAHAHEGHGLLGTHWHASDVWGFVALGVMVAAAVWLGRK